MHDALTHHLFRSDALRQCESNSGIRAFYFGHDPCWRIRII